jgi:UDP-N-acetylmuramate--alanine ligase
MISKFSFCGDVHFVGLGGVGMSGLARILKELGYSITGSDAESNSYTKGLEDIGIKIFNSHLRENVKNASCVVISSAIAFDNPEIIEAKRMQLPIVHRSHILYWIMKSRFSIAVAGSYGKSTTTSLIGHLLENYGHKPTVIVGATINAKKTNAYLGEGEYCVVESDESDASFLKLHPEIAVITTIDKEHLNAYGSFSKLIDSFYQFMTNISFRGFSVACIDNDNVRILANKALQSGDCSRIITCGLSSDANVRAENIRYFHEHVEYDAVFNVDWIGSFEIQNVRVDLIGEHNVKNSLAALSVMFGIRSVLTSDCFIGYQGIKRRCTVVGYYRNATIIDDYGVHPSAISQVIRTFKNDACLPGGRLIVVWQPHRYSRIENLVEEFSKTFNLADKVYITPVFSAWEKPQESFSFERFIGSVTSGATYVESLNSLKENLNSQNLNNRDIILFFGAGDITLWAEKLSNDV